jgi:hypothetical protein
MEREVIRFKFGDFFDPQDELSQWLVAVSLAVNDTTLTIRGLVDGFDDEPIYERVYRTRLVALHLWEAIELVHGGCRMEPVKAIYDASWHLDDPKHKEGLERVLKFRTDAASKDLRAAVVRCRNYFGHYPRLWGDRAGVATLAKTMTYLQDEETSYTISGPGYGAVRLDYADAVALDFLFPKSRDETHEQTVAKFGRFIGELRDLTTDFWYAATGVLYLAMERRPDLFAVRQPPQTKAQIVAARAQARRKPRGSER